MIDCLFDVRSWLCTNGLCLNPDKSDSIILSTHQRLRTFPAIPAVKIADIDINISNEITSLGVIMDSKLTLDSHISAICKSCYYHLRSLRHIRRSLSQAIWVVHWFNWFSNITNSFEFILCHINYIVDRLQIY